MSFQHYDGIRYFQFDSLKPRHAIFTRHGGYSPKPWASLNVGGTVGDERARVRANRNLSLEALGCEPDSVFDVWQVHGAEVVHATVPRPDHESVQQADIILTDKPELTLYMRFADCVPLMVHDPQKGVVGVAHAGWQGTLRNVAGATITAMQKQYGSQPEDIVAGIGPSIGPDHYEVGSDVIVKVLEKFGDEAEQLLQSYGDRVHFDLWKTNELLLKRAGVQEIEIAEICTACHLEDWFSHRAEKGRTGRFGALISLQ